MSKISNLDDLREVVLETIEKMINGKIDISEAGVLAKMSETVISGLKTQMEYGRLTGKVPSIPFLSKCSRVIEQSPEKPVKLLKKSKVSHE